MKEVVSGRVDRHEVLITRPAAEAEATAALVRAKGFVPVVAPMLRVMTARLAWPARYQGILVTSGNALDCISAVAGLGGQAPLFAVGDATAARARALGFGRVHSAGSDAAGLAALVRQQCPPGTELLLVAGAGQGHGLASTLRAEGFRVARRVGYTARPVGRMPMAAGAALRGGGLRAALFLSAETARAFVKVTPERLHAALGEVEALAIGAAAADALALLPWRRVRVSLSPTLEQVLALL